MYCSCNYLDAFVRIEEGEIITGRLKQIYFMPSMGLLFFPHTICRTCKPCNSYAVSGTRLINMLSNDTNLVEILYFSHNKI